MFSIGLKRHSLLLLDSVPCTTVIPDVSLIWISMISLGGDMWGQSCGSAMWQPRHMNKLYDKELRRMCLASKRWWRDMPESQTTRIGRPLYLPNVVICHKLWFEVSCIALLGLQHITASYSILQNLTTSYNHYKSQWYGPKAMEMFKLSKRLREMSLQWSMISLHSLDRLRISLTSLIHAILMPASKRGCCSSWPSSWENPNISSTSHLAS